MSLRHTLSGDVTLWDSNGFDQPNVMYKQERKSISFRTTSFHACINSQSRWNGSDGWKDISLSCREWERMSVLMEKFRYSGESLLKAESLYHEYYKVFLNSDLFYLLDLTLFFFSVDIFRDKKSWKYRFPWKRYFYRYTYESILWGEKILWKYRLK